MLENQNKIDELFNDFLHDYEEDAPVFVWNNVKAELKAKKRVHTLYYIRAFAASVAMFITFGLGYYVSDLDINQNHKVNIKKDENKLFSFGESKPSGDSLEIKSTNNSSDKEGINENKERLYKYAMNLKKSNSEFRIANYEKIRIFDSNQLYRKYKFINENFTVNNKSKKYNNLAVNNLSERKSNQLLTDTLLSGKENLQERGFLLQNEAKKKSAWSFGTKFSPVVSVGDNGSNSGIITADNSQSTGETPRKGVRGGVIEEKPDVSSEEKPLTSYSGGINVNYHLSRRFSLESGVFYAQKKQGADNLVGSLDTEFGGNNMTVYTPSGTQSIQQVTGGTEIRSLQSSTYYSLDANYVLNAEYIELPLIIRYKIIDQRISLDVMSGVSTNFLVKNSTSIVLNDQELWSGQNKDMNSILYGATFGLGVNYNFYQNLTFNLEPTFKYSILPENSVFSKYPYSFAVFAGFSYRFK